MSGHGEKLSRNKELTIAALLCEPSIRSAAEKVGINDKTIVRWLQEQNFKEAYRKARRQVVDHAVARIQSAMTSAVGVLEGVMNDSQAPASSRVTAAKSLIEIGLKQVQVDEIEARITALEETIKAKESNRGLKKTIIQS